MYNPTRYSDDIRDKIVSKLGTTEDKNKVGKIVPQKSTSLNFELIIINKKTSTGLV